MTQVQYGSVFKGASPLQDYLQTFKSDVTYDSGDCFTDSDLDSEEDSSYDSLSCLFEKDSLLKKLEISSTEEIRLVDEFYQKIENAGKANTIQGRLMSIKTITNEYLEKGIRLNLTHTESFRTVTELIFESLIEVINNEGLGPGGKAIAFRGYHIDYFHKDNNMDKFSEEKNDFDDSDDDSKNKILEEENERILKYIINILFLAGGRIGRSYLNSGEITHITYQEDYSLEGHIDTECQKIIKKLKSLACRSLVNENREALQGRLKVEIDNRCLYIKYMVSDAVRPATVMNSQEAKDLGLRSYILHFKESVVRVENVEGKRNYTDILKGPIEMVFTTEVGEISIYLSSSENSNKIKVEISNNERKKLDQLEDKEKIGENCLLGGLIVSKAIEQGFFTTLRGLTNSEVHIYRKFTPILLVIFFMQQRKLKKL